MNSRVATWVILGLTLTFLIGPFLIIIAASLSAGNNLAFPPQGISLKWFIKVFQIESFRASFGVSMFLAIFGTLAALVLGVPASYAMTRYKVPGAETVRLIVSSPIIVPGIIVGLALLRYLVIPTGFGIGPACFWPTRRWCCPTLCVLCLPAWKTCASTWKRPRFCWGVRVSGHSGGLCCPIFAAACWRPLFWALLPVSIRCQCRCSYRGRDCARCQST